MSEERKLSFGSDYKSNYNIPPLENWKNMRKYYLEKDGVDIGDFPIMDEAEEKALDESLAFLM